jgi:hypothetical protein
MRPDLVKTAMAPEAPPSSRQRPASRPQRRQIRQGAAAGAGREKTGYPLDMLDPDLDLEADLGVDTVKQADLFASVRAIYNIPRDENRKLRDFPTLAHVIRSCTSGPIW